MGKGGKGRREEERGGEEGMTGSSRGPKRLETRRLEEWRGGMRGGKGEEGDGRGFERIGDKWEGIWGNEEG